MKANAILKAAVAAIPLFFAGVPAVFGGTFDDAWIKGVTDKTPIDYAVGEKMRFTLTFEGLSGAVPAGEWFLKWTRSGDDGKREGGLVPVDGSPFVFETSIDRAGFVRLQARLVDKNGKAYAKKFSGDATTPEGRQALNRFERSPKSVFFDGGAGAGASTLLPHPEPKDFDAFWDRQFARLDRVPLRADRIEIASPNPSARLYAVRVDCAGLRPVTGYLSIPKITERGAKCPARLGTHGYSGNGCTHSAPRRVSDDVIVFDVNAHGLKLREFGATEADTKALRWEISSHDPRQRIRTYAFDLAQNADPETAYFNGMVLRVKRALQYLKSLKEWDGKDLRASGGSQGGLQTIWAAACGEGVTRAESSITWCCDVFTNGGARNDAKSGLASDGWYIGWTEAMGYYDAANFAKRIPKTCRTVISRAGLGDYCCPPTGLMKMWNNIPGNKEIRWVQGSQHGYVPPDHPERDVTRTAD